ncbi:hypothetical protein BCR44DRAFT_55526 [Catenaria anguillulae PL171]|uniref:Uncharacterized protein n=1 Tax=Catenaria anguillulae PL171 TaxID=765915 RepID=A0A1Y2HNQ9_9FUNG|nr:hypothetical protein BCR44DRAFT_55526 [Catenaria anguillulae PL171]
MADVLRIIVMRSLDTVVTESLARHNVPSRSPSLASLGSPDLRRLDELHENGLAAGGTAVPTELGGGDAPQLLRNSTASPSSVGDGQPSSRPASSSASVSSSPRASQEDALGLGFQLVDANDAISPFAIHSAQQSSVVDPRFEAMIQLRNNEPAQRQYQELLIKHLLLHKNEEHDDMLFYVPQSWPSAMRRDALSGIGPPSTPTYSTSSSDLLIVQRNVASTLSLPPNLPEVDWVMSVWLNVIMQVRFTSDVEWTYIRDK